MGVYASAVLVQREWKSNYGDVFSIQSEVPRVSVCPVVGEFKPILALPAQAAGVQSYRF